MAAGVAAAGRVAREYASVAETTADRAGKGGIGVRAPAVGTVHISRGAVSLCFNPAAARILTRQSGNLPGAGSVPAHHASTGLERAKPLHRLPLSPTHRRSPPTSTATLHQRALRRALAASARPAQVGASAQGGRRRRPKRTARAPRAALAHAPPPPPPRGHSPHRPRHAALRRAPQCRRGLEPARAQGERRVSAHLLSCERGVAARVQRRGAAARLLLRLRVRVVLEGGVALARRGHGRARSAARNCGRQHSFIICTAGAGLTKHCRRRVRVDMHAPCPRRAKALRHGGAAPGQQQPRARVARRLR